MFSRIRIAKASVMMTHLEPTLILMLLDVFDGAKRGELSDKKRLRPQYLQQMGHIPSGTSKGREFPTLQIA
jgi:hypothetical protein